MNKTHLRVNQILNEIKKDEKRNEDFLHLTANESQMSETARLFLGSKLSERYYMGGGTNDLVDFGVFTALGFSSIEKLIHMAEKAACSMLGASSVNLSCLSGVHAMMCAILSCTNPGDTVMTVEKNQGGHFATKGILERVGRNHVYTSYDYESYTFDVKKIGEIYKKNKAKAIYLDVSYYVKPHNLSDIRKAVGDEAIIIYDASHTMGLILGGLFQSPLKEGANVVCANTHKTLPGPQKGMIAFRDKKVADKANSIINGCLYSSPHTHHLIALATTILEMQTYGKSYAKQIISNSNAMGKAFEKLGYKIRKISNEIYSLNHQVHVFLEGKGERLTLYKNLLKNNISTNFDNVLGGSLFIRIGTQELTRRGMKENDMNTIAYLIDKAMKGEKIKSEVIAFNKKFGTINYSFD